MPNAPLRERLASRDLVTHAAAQVELGRVLTDALRGAVTVDGREGVALADVLTGQAGAVDLVRALLDVTTADVAGILPPSVGELVAAPVRPLFSGPWAVAWVERNEMQVPRLTALAPVTDTAEKTDIVVGAASVDREPIAPHTAAWAADFAAAIISRAAPRFRDTLAAVLLVALQRALEPLLMADLATGVTEATDVLDAVAGAASDFGGPTVVLATPGALAGAWQALGPLGAAIGPLAVVPVAGGTFAGALVTSAGNLTVEVGPLVPLASDDPTKLGYNLGYYLAALAWLADPSAARIVTATP